MNYLNLNLSKHLRAAICACALAFGLSAGIQKIAAQGLINPGFETGNFSGWTVTGPFLGVPGGGHTGSFCAYCGSGMNDNGTVGDLLSQTITTVPGANYDISIWVAGSANGGAAETYIDWNGAKVLDLSDATFSGWTQLEATALATGTQSTVGFGSRNDPSAYYFDDASVVAAVPEPSAMVLTGLGLAGLWAFRRSTASRN